MSYMKDSTGRRLDSIAIQSKPETDARYGQRSDPGLLPAPVVGTHPIVLESTQTDVGMMCATRHYAPGGVTELRLTYANYQIGSGDIAAPGARTVCAGIEYPIGSSNYYDVHFPGEDTTRTVTLGTGRIVTSEPVPITIPDGAPFLVKTLTTPVSPATAYSVGDGVQGSFQAAAGEYRIPATTTNNTMTVYPGGGSSAGAVYGPSAILGRRAARRPCVALIGDSIMRGTGDVTTYTSWNTQERGFGRAALANAFPYVFPARSGTLARDFQGLGVRYTAQLLARATHAVVNFGRNDLTGSRTLAQIQADLLAIWTMVAARGAQVYQTTITPSASSTDTWATTANQTPAASESVRVALNTWIRAGAPIVSGAAVTLGTNGALLAGAAGHPLTGYFETANTVETAQNSGIWKVGSVSTTDGLGIHPSSTGHAQMAAAIDTTKFTVPA